MKARFSVSRIDAAEITPSGAVRLSATPTRSGVFVYRRADGSEIREYRPPSEVSKEDSLRTLDDAPVTIGHPPGGWSPDKFQSAAVGHVRAGSPRADGAAVRASLVVARQDARARAHGEARDLVELSCGYRCDIDETPGVTPEGEAYDRIQRNIRYDHVALLPAGHARGGSTCRLDAKDEEDPDADEDDKAPPFGKKKKPKGSAPAEPEETKQDDMKITIAGKVYEGEAAQAAVDALTARADADKVRADSAESRLATIDADKAKAARIALETKAKAAGVATFVRKDDKGAEVALTDREIKIAVIQRTDSAFDPANRSDAYVDVRFDLAAVPGAATPADPSTPAGALNTPVAREDANEHPLIKQAREREAKANDLWRNK